MTYIDLNNPVKEERKMQVPFEPVLPPPRPQCGAPKTPPHPPPPPSPQDKSQLVDSRLQHTRSSFCIVFALLSPIPNIADNWRQLFASVVITRRRAAAGFYFVVIYAKLQSAEHAAPLFQLFFLFWGDFYFCQLGKGAQKKTRKKCGLLPNRGEGGSRRVVKCQTSILEKYFFS